VFNYVQVIDLKQLFSAIHSDIIEKPRIILYLTQKGYSHRKKLERKKKIFVSSFPLMNEIIEP
jgi:hypothetical protein